jgi:1-acyl-sn-glycerol-3-phosphate acyltransferase
LLQAALQSQTPIAAAGIDYHLSRGSVADEICYWRDMTLLPHLLNLFGKPGIDAEIRFAPAQMRTTDRKFVARELRAEVILLRR